MNRREIIVSKNNDGNYSSINEAIKNAKEHDRIFIKKGIYREKVFLELSNIELVGEDKEKTIIIFDDHARVIKDNDVIGTFESYTFYIAGENFIAKNLTFQNDAGRVAQAVALYVDGDKSSYINCNFFGFQDTLFIGPLPETPLTVSKFGGPADGKERKYTRAYFKGCYIEGDIDFIFGGGTVVFESCEIFSKDKGEDINGYITAASTPKDQEFGLVFLNCKLTSDAKENSVYLGRPWRDFAKTAFINCYMDKHIRVEGWDDWEKVHTQDLVEYVEYKSYGPGANKDKRVKYSRELDCEEVNKFNKVYIFKDWELKI